MKDYNRKTFMSWLNYDYQEKEWVRAIALCDGIGYFHAAINCLRDGSMGEKDENGVYERIWWADYIENDSEIQDVRPATYGEVCLYLKYCPLKKLDEKVVALVTGYDCSYVLTRPSLPKWLRYIISKLCSLKYRITGEDDLPF